MSGQGMDHNKVTCDHPGCPEAIHLAAIDTDHMRKVLHANRWWMDERGEIARDEITGTDFIGYKTLCPAHREAR